MKLYKEGIGALCRVEQDLATGLDKDGESIDDPLKIMMASIFDRKVRLVQILRPRGYTVVENKLAVIGCAL